MIRGLYTSALGMTTQMKKMDVTSNNIANADTTGFKKNVVVTTSFPDLLTKRLDDPSLFQYVSNMHHENRVGRMSLGVQVDSVFTDFTQGAIKSTGEPLNVTINGSGFMEVNVLNNRGIASIKYTRDGFLSILPDGTFVTKEGHPINGENGIITIPGGDIVIDESGNIFSDQVFIDRIRIVDFDNPESLREYGENLFDTTDESVERPFTGTIEQGFLENSNVNIVKEMVELITINRAYEANQRLVTTHDQTLGRAVNDIARK